MIVLLVVVLVLCNTGLAQELRLVQTEDRVILENNFVHVEFDTVHPQINILQADFEGKKNFAATSNLMSTGENILFRKGIVLERYSVFQNSLVVQASSFARGSQFAVTVLKNSSQEIAVRIDGIVDDASNAVVESAWTISLVQGERYFELDTLTRVLQDSSNTFNVRLSYYMSPQSTFAFFERGVEQMMKALPSKQYFYSNNTLKRFYALGEGGCVDIFDYYHDPAVHHTLLSSTNDFFASGFQQVLFSGLPATGYDKWQNDLFVNNTNPLPLKKGQYLKATHVSVAVNNFDFPAGTVAHPDEIQMPLDHIRAMYTGIYANPVGALCSYDFGYGMIAPTLATPLRAYYGLYNFYDPDSWMSISALMYSGDSYLYNEARKLLDKSLSAMLPVSGQIPHHFEVTYKNGTIPIYVAISGATQTGPNIFWSLAALQYVKNSGDFTWLKANMPSIDKAVQFLLNMYDPKYNLINAPGPLFIDVFIRNNFTTDSNSMLVFLLQQVAEAHEALGELDKAKYFIDYANKISDAINQYLWDGVDHYITQLNPDGTTRDFVDYDANLLAIALGIAPKDRAIKTLARIYRGKCTHAAASQGMPRPTFVSEIYYDKANCFLNNTGDSNVTMGRIGWAEAHALVQLAESNTMFQYVLSPMIQELLTHTWLYERYTCESIPTHNNYYIEYPEMVVMLLRELVYGINIGLARITISPLGDNVAYDYSMGKIRIQFSQAVVRMRGLPHGPKRTFLIRKLAPNATYASNLAGAQFKTNMFGELSFAANVAQEIILTKVK